MLHVLYIPLWDSVLSVSIDQRSFYNRFTGRLFYARKLKVKRIPPEWSPYYSIKQWLINAWSNR